MSYPSGRSESYASQVRVDIQVVQRQSERTKTTTRTSSAHCGGGVLVWNHLKSSWFYIFQGKLQFMMSREAGQCLKS